MIFVDAANFRIVFYLNNISYCWRYLISILHPPPSASARCASNNLNENFVIQK